MFVATTDIVNWRDLQEKVCRLFIEMDYEAETGKTIELAGRGKKEIDVFVTDPLASYNRTYLIECKNWDVRVPQEVVHSFKTVIEGAGANTGFIVSKRGFQSGAYEASRFTNIRLLTFEELQHLYGDEWFRKQTGRLQIQAERLQGIHVSHFDQDRNLCIHNNMYFHTQHLAQRLVYFQEWLTNILLCVRGISPNSYLGPEPVKQPTNPIDPLCPSDGWYEFPTVRDYFKEMTRSAKQCADEFAEFLGQAKASFEALPRNDQSDLYQDTAIRFLEELPIRVLRRHISQREYQELLKLIDPGAPSSRYSIS